jgi:hypothetical protein
MSVVRGFRRSTKKSGGNAELFVKVVLPRFGTDVVWKLLVDRYKDDVHGMRNLAMLALRECAGWTVEDIGITFGHAKGHVSRVLEQMKADIRKRFQLEPNMDPTELSPFMDYMDAPADPKPRSRARNRRLDVQ